MAAMTALGMAATDYTGTLTVMVNNEGGTQDASVSINPGSVEGTYTLSLKNFTLDNDGKPMPIGNIVVADIPGITVAGKTTLAVTRNILIENGDDPEVPVWFGPMIGEVPIALVAQFNDNDVNVDIDINLTRMEQIINVNFTNIEAPKTYEPGDVDRNGTTNGSDVTALYNILLK